MHAASRNISAKKVFVPDAYLTHFSKPTKEQKAFLIQDFIVYNFITQVRATQPFGCLAKIIVAQYVNTGTGTGTGTDTGTGTGP